MAGAPFLPKSELLARLAAGHSARITVVTPNRRLAQELAREFDAGRAAAGESVWETADILPFGAFLGRLHEDALYSELAPRLPLLLTEAQEQELWQSAIRESRWGDALLALPQAAADCRRAWALLHAWRIASPDDDFSGNDDTRAFAQWAKDYVQRCERDRSTDAARLADLLVPLLGESALRKPALLVAYAFDLVTPQERAFFDACAAIGIEVRASAPPAKPASAGRLSFPSAREELDAAARWARAKLEALSPDPSPGGRGEPARVRIGVVVPELGQRRKEVARVFARVMSPGFNLPGAKAHALPFNISLGAPLADYPVVRAALSILELACGEIAFEQASKLVRSPFLGGAESEMAPRARLDASMRKVAPARLTLGKLVGLVHDCPLLRQRLAALFALARQSAGARSPHAWARHFSALLDAAGFPGERSLDSGEYQARGRFSEALAQFAAVERVAPSMGVEQALGGLRRLCADTMFQPESPEAPIQILGVLESAGLEFDALWVGGLTDEVWPLRPRPNPFLAPALQKKAGIPEASPEASYARGKRMTEGWLAAASEVVMSWPAHEGDRALLPSPLIAAIADAAGPEAAPAYPRFRDLIFSARRTEILEDGRAPALATKTPRGGTKILSDQAACPFRAFAHHRLAAQALEAPPEGPDARARGLLLHTLMKELWSELKGSAGLAGDCTPAIERAAAAAVRAARLEEPFAALERRRLARLAHAWLEVERARPPFEVVATEERRKLAVGGLELNGRIDRLDRLASGGHVLIDYKSGRPTPNDWMGPRPDDPQLPLYALNAREDISAVAFAKLKTGEMRYMGFSRRKDAIPEVKRALNWEALLAGWRSELEALGSGFASGDARVDPKEMLRTCRYCDLHTLCRVYERVNALAEAEDLVDE
jgi:probable DNA repair protein